MMVVFPFSFERSEWLWLLATVPLLVIFSWRAIQSLEPTQRWAAMITRCLVVGLLVICMAGIEYVRVNQDLTVLFLLDRSHSIPKDTYAEQEQYVFELAKRASPNDRVGVLTFDGQSYIEQLPMRGGVFIESFPETVMPDRTDLSGAMRLALALFPEDTAKRIVVISDGNNNVGDVVGEVKTAVANQVGVDVLPIYYLHNKEVLVEKMVAPARVKDGDLVPLRAFINAKRPVSGTITLEHNGTPVALPKEISRQKLQAGQNLIGIKVPVHGGMPHRFELKFRPDDPQADTLVENNVATAFTFVDGGERVLLLTAHPEDDAELIRALATEKIEVDAINIADAESLDLLGFMRYSSIILANVGANWFTDEQQERLATFVREMGGGLIMIGGDESFGAGGWIGTPIEEIMPVDFEIKHRQVIPRGALVIIMHSCEMPRGNYWGKKVAEKSVETISSKDYFGLLSFSHLRGIIWDVPLQVAANKTAIKQTIQKIDNGDMPTFAETMDMAVEDLMEIKDASQRHIIIISDGDAAPPTDRTIAYMKANKITCSTVGIGYGQHVMEPTLRKIADDTGGRFYAAKNPKLLPQIFVKESKVVRRPLIVEQPFSPQLNFAMSEVWAGMPLDMEIPALGGLVMTSPKTSGLVEMPLIRKTSDGDDPVLVHWHVGLGKAVAFTSGYWRRWGQNWTQWPKFGKLWAQIVRWSMGQGKKGNFDIATRLDGTQGRVVVHALDKESKYLNFLEMSAAVAKPDGKSVDRIKLNQVAPGRYEATFDVQQTGQYIANLSLIEDGQPVSVGHTGLSVPYSPEYRELRANEPLLKEIVDLSGGRTLEMDVARDDVFRHDLPPTRSRQPVWEWVLAWLLLPMFLFDVAVRRLASMVALSIVVEILVDIILLFGVGIIYLEGTYAVWGTIGVILFGELIGWSIRFRSIRPTVEFFTHSVVTLRSAAQTSTVSLGQLKGTRERVQEDRIAKGEGAKLSQIKKKAEKPVTDSTARFDVGDQQSKVQAGDLRESLGGAKPGGGAGPIPRTPLRPEELKQPQEDAMTRLRKARERARDKMDDLEKNDRGDDQK